MESIKRSGGGVSERFRLVTDFALRVYQAFRWWGVGTLNDAGVEIGSSLSSVPVVGCRNKTRGVEHGTSESIKRSGGGVSEPSPLIGLRLVRVYQAFRWWGVGTQGIADAMASQESIKRSGGGVSERTGHARQQCNRVYQAFRWWGVGTLT